MLITIAGFIQGPLLEANADIIKNYISDHFGWMYLVSMTSFVIFMSYLIFSRFGRIRLGDDNQKPEFTTFSWFSMLFSAGMGIGLLFYSVAEPILHYMRPAPFVATFDPEYAHRYAMALTFFHWGIHPWACYALVGLGLAYFAFRKKYPLTFRSVFYPIFGERVNGRLGDAIDIITIVSTLFGVATSLGFGASQINAGLSFLFGVPKTNLMKAIIILSITGFATISVVSGLKRGIRLLSQTNIVLASVLFGCILILGPTVYIFNSLIDNLGAYISEFTRLSFRMYTFNEDAKDWQSSWTLLYWSWWIAWSPFVGMFIARISKGRTVREFALGVMAVPSLLSFIWLTAFGSSALRIESTEAGLLSNAINLSVVDALYVFLQHYPFSVGLSLIATASIVLFFVTSSDSASLVIDTIASGGRTNPPVIQKVYWAVLEGLVAAILLYSGGLKALQTASLTVALPLCLLLFLSMFGLIRAFRKEVVVQKGAMTLLPPENKA